MKDNDKDKKSLVALSLGGGGAKTFAHLGVIDALKEEDVNINFYTTSSAASVVTLLSVLGVPSQKIINKFCEKRRWIKLVRSSIFKQVLSYYLKERNITDINQLDTPIDMVVVDLKKGRQMVFDQGDPLLIPLGSAAFPGITQPIKYKNFYLVDGGVLNPDPADVARKRVGNDGIVVSVTVRLELTEENPGNRFNTILKALYMAPYEIRDEVIKKNSDIIITPLDNFKVSFSNWRKTFLGYFTRGRMEGFYKQGYAAGKKAVPEIKKLINRQKIKY